MSARAIAGLGFVGNAVGGLSVGEPKELFLPLLEASLDGLPEEKPRYVMGSGAPEDLLGAIALCADLVGMAYPFLAPALESPEKVADRVRRFVQELKICMFCLGMRTVAELRHAEIRKGT